MSAVIEVVESITIENSEGVRRRLELRRTNRSRELWNVGETDESHVGSYSFAKGSQALNHEALYLIGGGWRVIETFKSER